MMKEAEEMQKEATKIAEGKSTGFKAEDGRDAGGCAEGSLKRMEAQEKKEKEAMQAALQKQLAAPGHSSLPDWTPKTPNFTAAVRS